MFANKPLPWKRWKVWLRQFTARLHTARLRCGPRPQAAQVRSPDPADAEARDDEAPRGCGWFDSSHDLQQGLRVQEHLSADSLARELPLGAWLDLQLSGWRTAPPAFTPAG